MTKILMTAFGGLMALSGVALAGEQGSVAPMGAFVQDIGGQQVVGYYLAENDACQITMMTGASPSDEMPTRGRVPASASRGADGQRHLRERAGRQAVPELRRACRHAGRQCDPATRQLASR